MNAAARVTLKSLQDEGSVDSITPDPTTIAELQRQAGNHLQTARLALQGGDIEGAFQLAYDGCRKLCDALVQATGFRAKSGDGFGHHQVVFLAATAIAESFDEHDIVREAGGLRNVRHASQYKGEKLPTEDAEDGIAILSDLIDALTDPIDRIVAARTTN